MLEEIKKYPLDFLFLWLGLGILGWVFWHNPHLPQLQQKIVLLAAGFYFCWGVVHHWLRKDLCLRVVLEYLLISLFALGAAVVVLGLL